MKHLTWIKLCFLNKYNIKLLSFMMSSKRKWCILEFLCPKDVSQLKVFKPRKASESNSQHFVKCKPKLSWKIYFRKIVNQCFLSTILDAHWTERGRTWGLNAEKVNCHGHYWWISICEDLTNGNWQTDMNILKRTFCKYIEDKDDPGCLRFICQIASEWKIFLVIQSWTLPLPTSTTN